MAIVILLALAIYATIVSETGGGDTFEIWRPERMRLVLIALIVVGGMAYELRPTEQGKTNSSFEKATKDLQPDTTSSAAVSVVPEITTVVAGVDIAATPETTIKTTATAMVQGAQAVEVTPKKEWSTTDPQATISEGEKTDEAEVLWNRARLMRHKFIPDEIKDCDYLRMVRMAARLGHRRAMVKLGDYALRRGWIVEAYYWTLLAQLHGANNLDTTLDQIRKVWVKAGSPLEYENVTPNFSERQGIFARAVLRLKCGLDATLARKRLSKLVAEGCEDAKLFFARTAS